MNDISRLNVNFFKALHGVGDADKPSTAPPQEALGGWNSANQFTGTRVYTGLAEDLLRKLGPVPT